MKSKAILAQLLLFCVFPTVPAQTKPAAPSQPQTISDDDVVRITTNLVQVDAVVTKDGKIVSNLTADDFEIYEDGKKQTITSFAYIQTFRPQLVNGLLNRVRKKNLPSLLPLRLLV